MNRVSRRLPGWAIVLIAVMVFGATTGAITYDRLLRPHPAPYFESDEDHFLFGSVGTEERAGVPYWIWLVLPRIFPEYLPAAGGYASLGVPAREGQEMPVGFSKVSYGFPRVGINCATCHTATWRLSPNDKPTLVPAGPSHQFAAQRYQRFLIDCATDPRFTADVILAEIGRNYRLSLLDRLLYRFVIIPQTRRALLGERDASEWMQTRTAWSRGQIDPFNPVKFGLLRQPIDETIGNADMVPLWNMRARDGYSLHWDGLNSNLTEVVITSALGDGASLRWVEQDLRRWDATGRERSSLRRIQDWLRQTPAPRYPFAIDAALADSGRRVFAAECASCHEFGGARTGTIIAASEVGTDVHRVKMWTKNAAQAYNDFGYGYRWQFSRFRSTEGYVAVPLDGVWLRAPYLHNGSIPSLADLLEPVEQRPPRFYRGSDIYDVSRVGFLSQGREASESGVLYDTNLPANSNAGHLYGTTLPAEDKRALIEYLKTR